MIKLYKMRLVPGESGLEIVTDEWFCIYETPCFYHCVPKWGYRYTISLGPVKEQKLYTRKTKILKRISKNSGRFAFDTRDKAFKHLKMLKGRQRMHLERELSFVKEFLSYKNLSTPTENRKVIPYPASLLGFNS